MGWFKKLKPVFGLFKKGVKISKYLNPDNKVLNYLDKGISVVEELKNNQLKNEKLSHDILTKKAMNYALQNMDVLRWSKEITQEEDEAFNKGFLYAVTKLRYENLKDKF